MIVAKSLYHTFWVLPPSHRGNPLLMEGIEVLKQRLENRDASYLYLDLNQVVTELLAAFFSQQEEVTAPEGDISLLSFEAYHFLRNQLTERVGTWGVYQMVVLDNFADSIHDYYLTTLKLDLIAALITSNETENQHVVVISRLDPLEIEEVLDEQGKENDGEKSKQFLLIKKRMRQLFVNFYLEYSPFSFLTEDQENKESESPLSRRQQNIEQVRKEFEHWLSEECAPVPMLKEIKPLIARHFEPKLEEWSFSGPLNWMKDLPWEQEVISHIQNLLQFHYHVLWNSLSKEEKYVVYDLAQDELLNTRNMHIIETLKNRGILVGNGSVRLMNKSFRNYILTVVKAEEALEMEKMAVQAGAWGMFKGPLRLLFLGIIAFLFFTQKDSLGQVVAVVASFTATVPILLNFANMFGNALKSKGAK